MATSPAYHAPSGATSSTPRDEVDAILAAWALERPDVDTTPMQVLSRVSRLSRHLDLERRKAFAAHNLETWEFDVLSSLRREGEPYALTPGALMTELLVSSGTMTNRIDRLESAGLVTRTPSPNDRRAVVVSLTDEGKRRVDAALISLLECERAILAPLKNPEKEQLATLLRPLLLAFEQ
ncbi:MarR family winged helix-turn-helix transcriptional regulator [Schaalia sp. Marseille-Q2122]|uniref:MarR family winged helix-turn-helix transcriptional regulator n=1 Tax=Schaalia sp. Marseille-Q2122 TaxID=2736604 RepID=UPI00158B3710|nr:MarR family transcriptional regulator [Schaalia sp. Marseille-Q2122]